MLEIMLDYAHLEKEFDEILASYSDKEFIELFGINESYEQVKQLIQDATK